MRKKVILWTVLVSFLSCGENKAKEETATTKTEVIIRGEAQGTTYTVKYIDEEYNGVKRNIDSVLNMIDESMSTYLSGSTISRLNEGDTVILDEHFANVYQLSKEINRSTNGAFDPTIGPLIKAWGFDYSKPEQMDSMKVKALQANCGFSQFELSNDSLWKKNKEARINFNAVAQGYAVDLMASILNAYQLQNYYVELGGELVVKGNNKFDEPWVIGIDLPEGENLERKLANRVQLNSGGMATSGNYRKFYEVEGERFSHTLNPLTGYPAKNKLLSVTVIAENAGKADALATAFMVLGVEGTKSYLTQHPDLDALLIYSGKEKEYKTFVTEGMKKKLLKG